MLMQISVVDVLENGVEIPENVKIDRSDWTWTNLGSCLSLIAQDYDGHPMNRMQIQTIAHTGGEFRVFEIEDYIVILRKDHRGDVHLFGIFPEL